MLYVAYGNEEEVGVALREEGLKRDEVFVTTKYSEPDTTAQQALDASLQKVQAIHVHDLLFFVC